MTNDEFDRHFEEADLFDEYMEYIMENCHGERMICNGDSLVVAAEEGYLYEAFREDWIEKNS
jgi:hypothetical protein